MKKVLLSLLVLLMAVTMVFAQGQKESGSVDADGNWIPSKEVSVIVSYAAGGSTDLLARTFANEAASVWATPLVINNMPGGGNAIGFSALRQAAPDGLTIGNTNSSVVVNCLTGETPFVYYEELQPICQVGFAPYIVYVAKDSLIQNLADLEEAVKTRDVVMAANNRGGQTHWELEYFAMKVGSDITAVIYDGGSASIAAVLGGHAEVTVQAPSDGQEYVRSGDLRAIAVLDDARLETDIYKDVPTSVEQGYGWLQNGFFHGYSAPKGIGEAQLKYFEDGFKKALEIPEVREKIEYYGFTVDYQDAEGFRQVWLDTVEQYKTVIAELGDRLTE